MAEPTTATGRYLTYLLRHRPDAIGLALDEAGWADIADLLDRCAADGHPVSRAELDTVVAADRKGRFEVVEGRIRAAQGHSVDVELGLPPLTPPAVLFHGTVQRSLDAIFREGLLPGERRHVHLSFDRATAAQVGGRRGRPVILQVDAAGMHAAGAVFHRSSNGVWLTAWVAPTWLALDPSPPT